MRQICPKTLPLRKARDKMEPLKVVEIGRRPRGEAEDVYYDRGMLKRSAREALGRPWIWAVTLLFLLLSVHVPAALCALLPGVDLGAALGALASWTARGASLERLRGLLELPGSVPLAALAVGLFLCICRAALRCGYAGYALKVYRGGKAGAGDLFGGFSRLPTVLGAGVVTGLFSLLWGALIYGVAALASVLMLDLSRPVPAEAWFWLFTFFAAAAVVHAIVVCRYCLTPYFILTQPERGALSAVAESVEAMRGKAGRRWFLKLSFVGWDLLLVLVVTLLALAAAVVDVVLSDAGLARLGVLAEQAAAAADAGAVLERAAAELAGMSHRLLLAALAVGLVQLPFQLWLIAYKNVAYAGFFHVAAGGKILWEEPEEEPEEPETAQAPAPVPTREETVPVQEAPAPVQEKPVPVPVPVPAPAEPVPVPAAPAVAPYTPFYPGRGAEGER